MCLENELEISNEINRLVSKLVAVHYFCKSFESHMKNYTGEHNQILLFLDNKVGL